MKKRPSDFTPLTAGETRKGFLYLVISLVVLPLALQEGNALLVSPLSAARLNFVYYCVNFAAVVWIFRRFLVDSFRAALRSPFPTAWYGALGYLGSEALGELLMLLILTILPGFSNVNDQNVAGMLREDLRLIAIGTILLVPIAEETLYRGLIFRNLYDKSPIAAYAVSIGVFAAIHVAGYIGKAEPLQLLLCFVQYIPPGFCLCWCYRQTGTIAAPIIMHTIVNAMGVGNSLR
ncbi:MAG: CPBP family intramembrane metalloprotease [Oscillospiraceae bacterium]|nr:CPBP family intramembrane metalloprotease [Oscillospiraceae bacterium]